MSGINFFLSGAIAVQCLVISLFFIRYAKKAADNFFSYFAAAFLLLAIERIVWSTLLAGSEGEFRPLVYLFRLCAFVLIIAAILSKNYRSTSR